jgi:hypothetical protein
MTKALRLSRNARISVAAAVVLLLAGPVLVVWRLIPSDTSSEQVLASASDDRLLSLKNGTTMLLEHGSPARKIADWLKLGTMTDHSFAVGDDSFKPGSAEPSKDGAVKVIQFAQMLKAHPHLETRILVAHPESETAQSLYRLEQARAGRLRNEIHFQGVADDKVTTEPEPLNFKTTEPDRHSELIVVLSHHA